MRNILTTTLLLILILVSQGNPSVAQGLTDTFSRHCKVQLPGIVGGG